MSKMTLEPVLDEMREELASNPPAVELSTDALRRWADAIDAELKARGEPVAVADVERLGHGYPTTAYPLSHPNAASMGKLYTAPPAPKITDDMCERAATAFAIANPDWAEPRAHYMQRWRVALEAALKDTP